MVVLNRLILAVPFFIVAFAGLVVHFITRSDTLCIPFDWALLQMAEICEIEIDE